ncbi:GGDEF domain-containing protein [Denitrificimonas caeni]|uniref:GGDEF domain-containing protein n=1 Tax=Denitrificimonas caeni TaxID=521720 RepID=UPI0019628CBD|nr:GGDEF domain-containing protein [Denitrificimonas caeni]
MQNDALAWKNKYLQLLDQQEQIEVRFTAQAELLKRALIRSSLAAEGNDDRLDQQLQLLRRLLRKDINNSELEDHIEHLEKALLASEKTLLQRKETLSNNVQSFVQQLLQLQPPKDIQKALRLFEKSLEKQLSQPHSLYSVLSELKELQARVVDSILQLQQSQPQAAPGLLARLFKATPQNLPSPAAVEPHEALEHNATRQDSEQSDTQRYTEDSHDSYSLPLLDASYSSVAQDIHKTLNTLLNGLPITKNHEQQIKLLRSRLNQGLNWYELAPLLGDLSTVILEIAHGSENELESYLLQLNQRLVSFHDNLQITSTDYTTSVKDAKALDSDLRQHVSSFQDDVHTSTDLNELKKRVDTRLDNFINTLQVYQEKREQNESAIFERFQALSDYSKQMEKEAQLLSVKLEDQHKKALLDPLTELANRAAWNERSALEHARIQRNNSSLILSIIDIDHFKRINDSYGHLAGDKVLKVIAYELNKRIRKTDFIARFGGEEYALLLPDTPLEDGYKLLDKLRLAIEACPFNFRGEPITITLSAGIGQIAANEPLEQAFERIDQALYAAKKAGRNNVQIAKPPLVNPATPHPER